MTAKQGGLGRKPGKRRRTAKVEGLETEGTAVHVAAAARRDAAALLSLTTKSPAGAAAGKHLSPSTLKAASSSKYHRDKVAGLEEQLKEANDATNAANACARASEKREVRAKELAEQRLKKMNTLRPRNQSALGVRN